VIAKTLKTYVSLKNLGLSLGEIHCSSRKVPFSLGNLAISSKKKFIVPKGSCIFHQGIFLTPWGTCLKLALSSLLPGSYFIKAINFKNYLNVLWIFSSTLFIGRSFGLKGGF